MKVFISYGSALDQVTALRLQALGAVHGLTVYVPPAYTREPSFMAVDPDSAQKLAATDTVLGIITGEVTSTCDQELMIGQSQKKPLIVMAGVAVARLLQSRFGQNLVVIDPANPAETESAVVTRLKSLNASRQAENALLVVGTLALGLVIAGLVLSQD